jgi:hypothetical protein
LQFSGQATDSPSVYQLSNQTTTDIYDLESSNVKKQNTYRYNHSAHGVLCCNSRLETSILPGVLNEQLAPLLRLSVDDMKKSLLALAIPSLIFTSCVERTVYVRQPAPPPPPVAVEPAPAPDASVEVVTEAPPAPQVEVQVAAPGPGFIWTPGYWAWHGRWVWVGGRWAHPPHRHAVWVAGHWDRRPRGYIWVGGHWR